MGLIVQKYGGTSVKDAERVMNVARRITDAYKAGNNVVVAVSAQGDTTDDLIEKAIRQLPPQCQKIFIMNRFNDKSITQIAEELEISPRTVEKHIEIALKKLRQELADYLPAGLLLWLLNI